MAASWVEIGNSALSRLGIGAILSLDDDTKEARAVKARIFPCRDLVLRSHPWQCATKRVVLAALVDPPAFGFNFQLPLPEDFLRLIATDPDGIPYALEGKKILCDVEALPILYVAQVNDPTVLDVLCAECIGAQLAYDLSYQLIQNPEAREYLRRQYEELLREARAADAQEGFPKQLVADHYERARRGVVW